MGYARLQETRSDEGRISFMYSCPKVHTLCGFFQAKEGSSAFSKTMKSSTLLSHLSHLHCSLESWHVYGPRDTTRLKSHVVDPAFIGPDGLAFGELGSEIQPVKRVAHGADLVTDMVECMLRHAMVKRPVRPQIKQVARHRVAVTDIHQEPILAMVDLERDTAGSRGNDRLALVYSLRYFHLKPFPGR